MRIVNMSCTTSLKPASRQTCARPPGRLIGLAQDLARRSFATGSSMAAVSQNSRKATNPPRVSHVAAATAPPRTRDAAHLTCREFGLRDELQDKHGKRVVKRGIGERQCAGI